jgi:2-methylcitrate dehydratase PrpD
MGNSNRRNFLKISAAAAVGATALAGRSQGADGESSPAKSETGGVPAPRDVTRTLARYLVNARYEDLPANVRREGTRTLVNWVGVAVGGSGHEAVERAASALGPFSGPKQASLLGRRERFDIMNAAFINGVSSHVFDFDDTHLNTAIHPAAPVMSAILALSEYQPVSGKDFLTALVLGVETECRIGNAISPGHRDRGWHITGVTGVFGAAAATSKLLKLSEEQTIWAFGLAASQPVGLLESHGSMSKAFIPGRAGANGLFGALLASKNFTSADEMMAGKWTWATAISSKQDYREITEGLGQRFEAALNTYKPFSCAYLAPT